MVKKDKYLELKEFYDISVQQLKDLLEKGDDTASDYDCMMGYFSDTTAALLVNHVKYHKKELLEYMNKSSESWANEIKKLKATKEIPKVLKIPKRDQNWRFRKPIGKKVPELIQPGMVVKTNYGSGPYIVTKIAGPYTTFDTDSKLKCPEHWSLHLKDHDTLKGGYYINYLVAIKGKLLNVLKNRDDEVFIIKEPKKKKIANPTNLFEAIT